MALSDVVKEVMTLANAAHQYWERELPKRHPNYPLVNEGEDSGPPPPEETKLEEMLEHLPDEVIWQLALIVYLGRGNFARDDLPTSYKKIKREFEKPEWAVNQLLVMSPLADYLSMGLEALNKRGIDLDTLPQMIAA